MEGSRLHILVCDGALELELNGKPYEMKGPALLDIMDTESTRICGHGVCSLHLNLPVNL